MKHDYWDEIKQMENAYDICRKRVMNRYQLSAIEVDVLLFLANNPRFDTASDISAIRRIPKSHVSLAVKLLHEKGYLLKAPNKSNKKRMHLVITETASEIVRFGINQQTAFMDALMEGFSAEELELLNDFSKRISDNLCNYEKNAYKGEVE